jgi:hypothetical protein
VIHTAEHTAVTTGSRLTRGHCGQKGVASGLKPALPSAILANDEACQTSVKDEFNLNLPFSRNVYIEQGQDVYIVSSLFDSLIQRPEPSRQHLAAGMNVYPCVFMAESESTSVYICIRQHPAAGVFLCKCITCNFGNHNEVDFV